MTHQTLTEILNELIKYDESGRGFYFVGTTEVERRIREWVDRALPPKKHSASGLHEDMNSEDMNVIECLNKGYNQAVTDMRTRLGREQES